MGAVPLPTIRLSAQSGDKGAAQAALRYAFVSRFRREPNPPASSTTSTSSPRSPLAKMGVHYYVMEYCQGDRSTRDRQKRLPWESARHRHFGRARRKHAHDAV
jgi:hypothetical protein